MGRSQRKTVPQVPTTRTESGVDLLGGQGSSTEYRPYPLASISVCLLV